MTPLDELMYLRDTAEVLRRQEAEAQAQLAEAEREHEAAAARIAELRRTLDGLADTKSTVLQAVFSIAAPPSAPGRATGPHPAEPDRQQKAAMNLGYLLRATQLLFNRCISLQTFFWVCRERPIAVAGRGGSYELDGDAAGGAV